MTGGNSHIREWVAPPPLHDGDLGALAAALRDQAILREAWLYGHLITEQDGSQQTKLAVAFVIHEYDTDEDEPSG